MWIGLFVNFYYYYFVIILFWLKYFILCLVGYSLAYILLHLVSLS